MSGIASKYILDTLTYYDVMDYPMTVFEIWKYLIQITHRDKQEIGNRYEEINKISIEDVALALENEQYLKKYLDSQCGYYFLKGRNDLVRKRLERNKISEKKLKIVLRIARIIRGVPFVRMIAIAGRLATKNAERKSDLDLFIAMKCGKIFTGRFLVTILVHLLGKRRHGAKITDRICLNHFVTTKFVISAQDIFSSHEYVFLRPVFGSNVAKLLYGNNDWIGRYKPNFSPAGDCLSLLADSVWSGRIRRFGERICGAAWIEKFLGEWQKNKIRKNPNSYRRGGLILYSDDELAFWPNFEKQGPAIFEKFQARLEEMRNK